MSDSLWQQFMTTVFKALIDDVRLRPSDVHIYGILWHYPWLSRRETARRAQVARESFRRAARRLLELDWAYEADMPRGTAVIPWMPVEVEQRVIAQLSPVREGVPFRGEWLMRCLLDLWLRNGDFIDNARPEWLVSGDGSGRLELDRWYVASNVAFEYQGQQHYRVGTPYTQTQEQLQERIRLDRLKAQLCRAEGIRLIYVHPSDLSLEGIRRKLEGVLPIFPLAEDRPLVRFIERQCRSYRNFAARAQVESRPS